MCAKLNVLWTKEKFQETFSTGQEIDHASGDAKKPSIRCCRLCGDDGALWRFDDVSIWEGVEQRYDHILFECYGVIATPSDCFICDRCVQQLRATQRFRALILAAFGKPPSEPSSNHTHTIQRDEHTESDDKNEISKGYSLSVNCSDGLSKVKVIIDSPVRKHRNIRNRKSILNPKIENKRINIACVICKQKYPMLAPPEGLKDFVCSRCKKNEGRNNVCRKYNAMISANMMRNDASTYLRRNNRLSNSLSKKSLRVRKTESVNRNRRETQCCDCKNLTTLTTNLNHQANSLKDSSHYKCDVCSKVFKSKNIFDTHLKTHTTRKLFQCNVCLRMFKTKRSLLMHSVVHGDLTYSNN